MKEEKEEGKKRTKIIVKLSFFDQLQVISITKVFHNQ
jgi:hypothetical protein